MGSARKISFLFLVTILTVLPSAKAEYRVFELAITNQTTDQSRKVLSILDDIQYPTYYPLKKDEKVLINETWMCWSRSDISQDPAQRFCPNPRAPASVPAAPPLD